MEEKKFQAEVETVWIAQVQVQVEMVQGIEMEQEMKGLEEFQLEVMVEEVMGVQLGGEVGEEELEGM